MEEEHEDRNPTKQTENNKQITPKATNTQDKTIKPNNRNSNIILGGDFNGHHGRWESSCNHPNQSGRVIAHILENEYDIELLATPANIGTRQNPSSLTYSTIDLTLMSPSLALASQITRGPHLGSDHLPIHIKTNAEPTFSIERPQTWIFTEANWTTWNKEVNKIIINSEFYSNINTEDKYQIYYNALKEGNRLSKIRLTKAATEIKPEPAQPWWTEECRKAVAATRRARNRCDPSKGGVNCDSIKEAWKKKENEKKNNHNQGKEKFNEPIHQYPLP
ncbi:hypothetical protein GHT06_015205 [Daphnia sinensis]|uniref:Endonuclease/exonuclease/phosphatase domain-containing protein n=1 Tax=Daphnia sinensis TaxID=1820382 RepID=A0AAD5LIP4_9CRUS|nr:hypothetical protein GHT06_015205 [Daphnia sinensis]